MKRTVTTTTAKEGVTVPPETVGQISPSDVLFTSKEDYSGNAAY